MNFQILPLLVASVLQTSGNLSNGMLFFVNAEIHLQNVRVSGPSVSSVVVRALFDETGRVSGVQDKDNNASLSSVRKIEDIVSKQGGFNEDFQHELWFDLGETNNNDTVIEDPAVESIPSARKTMPTKEEPLPIFLESDQVMFTSPHGILTTQNYVFVSDSYRNVIEKRDVDGQLLETYGDGSTQVLNFPTGMALWDDTLYICDSKNHRIVQMDIHTGEFVDSFGTYGLEAGVYFDFPRDITFDSTGNMYIAEAGNRRIQKFSVNGDFQHAFSGACGGMRKLRGGSYNPTQCRAFCGSATGIAVDPEDNVYVAFPDKNVVVKYNNLGREMHMYGKIGEPNREFQAPLSVSVDSTGHLYVVDSAKGWVTVYYDESRFLGMYHGKRRPSYVAIDTSDNAYVIDFPI